METLPKDQGMWNAIATVVFAALFVLAFGALTGWGGRPWHMTWLYDVDVFDILLMSLATFRLVRLVSFDKIFGFVRDLFMDEFEGVRVKPAGGFRRLVAELIECLWCTGLWAGLFVVFAYTGFALGRFFVLVLAVAAVGSFLQNVSKAVGKFAEK